MNWTFAFVTFCPCAGEDHVDEYDPFLEPHEFSLVLAVIAKHNVYAVQTEAWGPAHVKIVDVLLADESHAKTGSPREWLPKDLVALLDAEFVISEVCLSAQEHFENTIY